MIREVLKIMPIPIKHYYFFVLSVSVLSFLEISFWAIFSLVISVSPPDLPSHLLELDSFDLAYLLLIVICSRFIFQLFHAWLINKVGFDYLNFIRDFIVDKIIKSKFSDFESIGKAKATNDITLNTAVFVDSVILNIMKIVSDLFNLIIVSFIVIYIFGINSLIVIVSLLFMGFFGWSFFKKKIHKME